MAEEGTVMAFDFGERRIGVAIGERLLGHARPLETIHSEKKDVRFAAIEKLIRAWQPNCLVVGLPIGLEGDEHPFAPRCRRFANQLHGRFSLPVTLVDERFSSAEAESSLRETGLDWRQRREKIDAHAAAFILQSYFDGTTGR